MCINIQPAVLAAEIARVIQAATPVEHDTVEIQRQVLRRHAELRLGKRTAPEEVIEGFFRCLVTDHLQQRFKGVAKGIALMKGEDMPNKSKLKSPKKLDGARDDGAKDDRIFPHISPERMDRFTWNEGDIVFLDQDGNPISKQPKDRKKDTK